MKVNGGHKKAKRSRPESINKGRVSRQPEQTKAKGQCKKCQGTIKRNSRRRHQKEKYINTAKNGEN